MKADGMSTKPQPHINTYTNIQARSIIYYLYTPTHTHMQRASIGEEWEKASNIRHAKTNKYYIDTQQHIPIKISDSIKFSIDFQIFSVIFNVKLSESVSFSNQDYKMHPQ